MVDAEVMQLTGTPPSAVSTCSLYPTQEVVWRRCACCRHRRPSAGLPASAELIGSRLGSPAPLPCMGPLHRRRHPARCARQDGQPSARISVSCRRLARRLSVKLGKGAKTSPARKKPHSRHSLRQPQASIRPRVVGTSGLGYEGRASVLGPRGREKSLDPHQFQNREELVASPIGPKPREQLVERRTSNPHLAQGHGSTPPWSSCGVC